MRDVCWTYVGFVEEVNKEQQVAEIHEPPPRDAAYAGGAVALRHPVVDQHTHKQTHDHLSDLQAGDDHVYRARHTHTSGPQSVVGVHEGVDGEVHGHEPPTTGHHLFVAVPGINQRGHVVEPVQEQQLLLPQHVEGSVT